MKKFTKKLAAAAMALTMLAGTGCAAAGKSADSEDKLGIVCTIFPEYDWVREILGDKADGAEITYLLDKGADLHSFQPTAEDIAKIARCDLFIYVGGESDEWAEDAIKEATNKDMKVIDLLSTVGDGAKVEELKEGMEPEEEEEEAEGEEEGEEEPEYDEHVWLSLKNAETICGEIEKALAELDPDNADTYKANLDSYNEKLSALDSDFKTLIDGAGGTTLIFGDRFPFRYFADDYGIDYYAAFVGCSAETEASFKTIAFLAEKADELNADTIYTIENSDGKIAQAIIGASSKGGMTVAELNSVQSVSREQIEGGATYLSLMRKNYDVLKADIG